MKTVFKSLLIASAFLASVQTALASIVPAHKLVPIEEVFAPKGFDDNDSVEIVVSGFLPNLCYKSPTSKVSLKDNRINITLTALDYDQSFTKCLQMVVPFVHVVSVGLLKSGEYSVTVNGKSVFEKSTSLVISHAPTNKIDDFTYASVENVVKTPRSRLVRLQGYNPSDCFELDEIKVVSNGRNAYSVLPTMKQVSDFCPMKMMPFNYEFEVPTEIEKDNVLLHVRAMDGKSVNAIFNEKLQE